MASLPERLDAIQARLAGADALDFDRLRRRSDWLQDAAGLMAEMVRALVELTTGQPFSADALRAAAVLAPRGDLILSYQHLAALIPALG